MHLFNIKQQVGQRLIVGFQGEVFSEAYQKLALEWNIGGYIFFRRNLKSIEGTLALLKSIQVFYQKNHLSPPWLSVDEEGGKVRRLPAPFTTIGAMENLGKKNDPSFAFELGALLGLELSSLGFNLNFSPVLDVNSNPLNPVIASRSISHDPQKIPALAKGLILGMKKYGVMACGKHFPGHGDTKEDSHQELAFCYHQQEELSSVELFPFQSLIADNQLELLMTAHVKYMSVDPHFPATLSEYWIRKYLRESLQYQGLIITDDLEMLGIEKLFSQQDIAKIGLSIGIDLFLVCHQLDKQKAILEAMVQEIEQGRYTIDQLNQRAHCLKQSKQKYQSLCPPAQTLDQINAILGNPQHLAIAKALELGAENKSV
jgi:beta-N-acetylhexosaminidase